jgi:hypothetical protein
LWLAFFSLQGCNPPALLQATDQTLDNIPAFIAFAYRKLLLIASR